MTKPFDFRPLDFARGKRAHWFRIVMALTMFCLLAPAASRADVTRVDVQRREDVLGGKSFGSVGPYEKIVGKVYFAVDPNNPHNKIIVDLDKAPKNAYKVPLTKNVVKRTILELANRT